MTENKPQKNRTIAVEAEVGNKIFSLRGKKVMLDRDLAELYGVKTGALNQAVKRNKDRFPPDFMFQLTSKEIKEWMSQIVISDREKRGLRKSPHVFTEQGVAMLSGVLKSKRAIQVNIAIMRLFVRLRQEASSYQKMAEKINQMEKKYNKKMNQVFDILDLLLDSEKDSQTKEIGFKY